MLIKDLTAVIAGATGGIGSEICKKFSERGAKIVAIARSKEKLSNLAGKIGKDNIFPVECDFTDQIELRKAVELVRDRLSTIDILVNSAGIGIYGGIEDIKVTDWERSFAVNVDAPFYLIKSFLPLLKNSTRAVVINLGSGMGEIPMAGRSVYCATKFALRGMTLSLAEEFAKTNIRFVHLALGSVLTGFGPMTLKEKKEENLKGKSYLTPASVAERITHIIENDEIEDEIRIYPTGYASEKSIS